MDNSLTILVLTPTGNDAMNAIAVLRDAGMQSKQCAGLADACKQIEEGAGALLIAEEAFTTDETGLLMKTQENRKPWSDIPLVLISAGDPTRKLPPIEYAPGATESEGQFHLGHSEYGS